MTTVVCVLRSGGDYLPEHVARLYDQVSRHAPHNTEFICLTDQASEVDALAIATVPLAQAPPGWWAKMCVFQLAGPALYLDLDVSILGDLAPLIEAAEVFDFIACRDFWVGGPHRMNSSVMAWLGDLHEIYDAFAADPAGAITRYEKDYRSGRGWGDQGFAFDSLTSLGVPINFWQDLSPGLICSYKLGALAEADISDCRVLVSHGRPRPWGSGGADQWLKRQRKAAT